MMPSTSVQIQSSEAFSAAARMDAEKSDPPRPSVVGRPSMVAPLKPVTIGRIPASSSGRMICSAFLRVSAIIGVALPKTASVTITSAPLMARAGTPLDSRYSEMIRADSRSPIAHGLIHRARRPLTQHPHAVRDARKSAMSAWMPERCARAVRRSAIDRRLLDDAGTDARDWPRFRLRRRPRRGAACSAAGRSPATSPKPQRPLASPFF